MTPAEELAKSKKRTTLGSSSGKTWRPTWNCTVGEARESLKLTLVDVGNATGINYQTVRNVELGCDTSLSIACKLAFFFGKTIPELWPSLAQPKEAT